MKRGKQLIVPVTGLVLIFIFVLLQIFGGAERDGIDDKSIWGYWAFDRFLKMAGYRVLEPQTGFPATSKYAAMIIFGDAEDSIEYYENAYNWVDENTALILIGTPDVASFLDDYELEFDTRMNPLTPADSLEGLGELDLSQELAQVVINNERIEPLILSGEEASVVFRLKDAPGDIIIISDPAYLTNQKFLFNEHAVLMNRVLAPYINYDFTFSRSGLNRPYLGMQVFIRGKLGILMLQILIFSLLFGWFMAVRFGSPDVLTKERRRDLSEHLTAVGRFYSQTNHWSQLDRMEKHFFINQLRIHLPKGGDERHTLKKLLNGKVEESIIDLAFRDSTTLSQLKKSVDCRQKVLGAVRKERGTYGS